MGKIHPLPENLINQIAAGEVVERPASVVKELCENALDAEARSIRINLIQGGLKKIAVIDDGCGMSPQDAQACLNRHATSKLLDAAGLQRISTMGFRGEAIPAIASVSRFTLTTREATSDVGIRLIVEGGKLLTKEEIGCPAGTTILVEDLFFNTPARRKFMKRAETEAGHSLENAVRLALARPEVGFTLFHGERRTFWSQPSPKDARERIAAALGSEVFAHLVEVDHQIGNVRVHGQVASPDYTLATSRGIYTFVNGRFVRDRSMNAAILRAFTGTIVQGRQPVAVLFLDLPLEDVDVNVHPQKLEVRFADSAIVFDVVHAAVKKSLEKSPWLPTPPLVFQPVTNSGSIPQAAEKATPYRQETFSWKPSSIPSTPSSPLSHPVLGDDLPKNEVTAHYLSSNQENKESSAAYFHSLRIIGQFAQTYWICEAPGPHLIIVDQHAAHERLQFHRLKESYRHRKALGQAFLFPCQVELPLAEARILTDYLSELLQLGIDAEPFGGSSFALKAVPASLVGCDYRKLLTDLASELMQTGKSNAFEQVADELLTTMACHSSVRARQTLSTTEIRTLLDALDEIDFNTRCPHGRPIYTQIDLAELEKRVSRR
jgi:DNA mismatch repair protein MutL